MKSKAASSGGDSRLVKPCSPTLPFELLLSGIDQRYSLKGIDWIIVGGESGPKSRPMEEEWIQGLHRMADRDGAKFFSKQCGEIN